MDTIRVFLYLTHAVRQQAVAWTEPVLTKISNAIWRH